MKTLNSINYIAVSVAAALLAGCGGPQNSVSQNNGGVPPTSQRQELPDIGTLGSGGAFNGSYAGTYTHELGGNYCQLGYRNVYLLNGTGRASFIGRSRESGSFGYAALNSWSCGFGGGFNLVSLAYPKNSIYLDLKPPNGQGYPFFVAGGTGKFAKATGHGIYVPLLNSNGTYVDEWSGTIRIPTPTPNSTFTP